MFRLLTKENTPTAYKVKQQPPHQCGNTAKLCFTVSLIIDENALNGLHELLCPVETHGLNKKCNFITNKKKHFPEETNRKRKHKDKIGLSVTSITQNYTF